MEHDDREIDGEHDRETKRVLKSDESISSIVSIKNMAELSSRNQIVHWTMFVSKKCQALICFSYLLVDLNFTFFHWLTGSNTQQQMMKTIGETTSSSIFLKYLTSFRWEKIRKMLNSLFCLMHTQTEAKSTSTIPMLHKYKWKILNRIYTDVAYITHSFICEMLFKSCNLKCSSQ